MSQPHHRIFLIHRRIQHCRPEVLLRASWAAFRDTSMLQICLNLILLLCFRFIIGIMRYRGRLLRLGGLCRILFFYLGGSRFLRVIGGGLEGRRSTRIIMFHCGRQWLLVDIRSLLGRFRGHRGTDAEEPLGSFLHNANFQPLYKSSIIKTKFLLISYFPLILHRA
jgi:hypothetical protein